MQEKANHKHDNNASRSKKKNEKEKENNKDKKKIVNNHPQYSCKYVYSFFVTLACSLARTQALAHFVTEVYIVKRK